MQPRDWEFYQYFNVYANKNAGLKILKRQSMLYQYVTQDTFMAAKVTVETHHPSYPTCTPQLPGEYNARILLLHFLYSCQSIINSIQTAASHCLILSLSFCGIYHPMSTNSSKFISQRIFSQMLKTACKFTIITHFFLMLASYKPKCDNAETVTRLIDFFIFTSQKQQ